METSEVTKKCQFCGEEILFNADVCKHCHRNQIDDNKYQKMIDDLSYKKDQSTYLIIGFIGFLFSWWIGILAILFNIISVYYVRNDLKKQSMLIILEKHESYLKRKKVFNIIFYIILSFIIISIILYYAEYGNI
jgi:hypothetical protein